MAENKIEPPDSPLPSPEKLGRKFMSMRGRLVCAAIASYFLTMYVIVNYGTVIPDAETISVLAELGKDAEPVVVLSEEKAWNALEWLITAVFGVAIAGDTARPSGAKQAAFGVTTNASPS